LPRTGVEISTQQNGEDMIPEIPVRCRTNLDDVGNEQWPEKLPAIPRVGDTIYSGTKWGQQSIQVNLKVVAVTWKPNYCAVWEGRRVPTATPTGWYAEIEMHLDPIMFKCVSHFEAWYDHIRGRTDTETYQRRIEALQKEMGPEFWRRTKS
jgi:hypothetical protein